MECNLYTFDMVHGQISFKGNDLKLLYRLLYQCASVSEVYHHITGSHDNIKLHMSPGAIFLGTLLVHTIQLFWPTKSLIKF